MALIRVAAAIIVDGDRLLVAQRAKGPLSGLWEFPGGKVEKGETDEAALLREIEEELGLKIKIERRLGEFPHYSANCELVIVAFIAQALTKKFQLVDHTAVRWVTLDELDALKFAPADRPVVNALRSEPLSGRWQ